MDVVHKVAAWSHAHLQSIDLGEVTAPQHVLPLAIVLDIKHGTKCSAREMLR